MGGGISQDLLNFLNCSSFLLDIIGNHDFSSDGSFLISVGPDVFTHTDTGLENGTQYCYYIIATYDEGDSQPTPEVCAAPDAGPMCPPENLVTNVEDGDTFVHLDWDAPNAGCEEEGGDDTGGADGECAMGNCDYGYVEDCSGDGDCCPETWIGDGFADCEDQAWGCDLTCCDNDGGDCYYGNSNNDGDKPHLSELENHEQTDLQLRLNGYSIYRNLELIAQVGEMILKVVLITLYFLILT